MARGFLGLRGKEERKAKLRIRRELQDLRAENRGMSRKEFRKFAIKTFEERYEGIDISKLEEILELIIKYLPMILALFAMLLVSLIVPISAKADFTVFAAINANYDESEDGHPIPMTAWSTETVAADTTVTTTTMTITASTSSCGAATGPVRNITSRIRSRQLVRGMLRRTFRPIRRGSCG